MGYAQAAAPLWVQDVFQIKGRGTIFLCCIGDNPGVSLGGLTNQTVTVAKLGKIKGPSEYAGKTYRVVSVECSEKSMAPPVMSDAIGLVVVEVKQ